MMGSPAHRQHSSSRAVKDSIFHINWGLFIFRLLLCSAISSSSLLLLDNALHLFRFRHRYNKSTMLEVEQLQHHGESIMNGLLFEDEPRDLL